MSLFKLSWPAAVSGVFLCSQAKRQSKRKGPRVYYTKDKNGKVTGGPDLHLTAHYSVRFAAELFKVWQAAFENM